MRANLDRTFVGVTLTLTATACGPRNASGGEEGFSDGYDQGESDTGPLEPEPEPPADLPKDGDGCQDALDILMIVDNSTSMGSAQRRAAQAIDTLLGPMEQHGIDWRFAVTNTSVYGHPAGSGPQGFSNGHFQFIPCNHQLENFSAGTDEGFIDVSEIACTDVCSYEQDTIYTEPTTTHLDDVAKPRKWIERIDGVSNLPAGIDPVLAARCIAPQGIDGSGFEQPLEAMWLGLDYARTPDNDETGFLRPDASLLIVIITDEADCSTADFGIFSPFGDKTFWPDPTDSLATGAICWNAGTSCSGAPPTYDDCAPADYAADGSPASPENAVMFSVSRYIGLLEQIEAEKQAVDPGADVAVTLIVGRGLDGEYHYTDVSDTDPQHMLDYGIGPGCSVPDPFIEGQIVDGIPPVRLRAVADALSTDSITSICEANFGPAFGNIYEQLFGAC